MSCSSDSAARHSSSLAASSLRCASMSNTADRITRGSPRRILPCVLPMYPAPRIPTLTVMFRSSNCGFRIADLKSTGESPNPQSAIYRSIFNPQSAIRNLHQGLSSSGFEKPDRTWGHSHTEDVSDFCLEMSFRSNRDQSILALQEHKCLVAHFLRDIDDPQQGPIFLRRGQRGALGSEAQDQRLRACGRREL